MFIIRKKSDLEHVISYLNSMGFDTPKCVEIDEYKGKRTKAQNSYFHMCCGIIAKDTGYEPEEVKSKIVLALWEPEITHVKVKRGDKLEDVTLMERKSTASLTKEEFTLLVNQLMQVAGVMNIRLPMPQNYEER